MPEETHSETSQSVDQATGPFVVPSGFQPRYVPGYELLGELGRGGMGVVWKARQVSLNRLVALKMLLGGDAAGPVEVARFQAEAEAVARLQHPSIVQIFEVGQHEGRLFFSLEYVEGGTLKEKLSGTPLPVREAATQVEELANAVQYAHERNILHRDIKPGNVLLTGAGRPKLTDFGLAKTLDSLTTAGEDALARTQTGAIMGTPSYMAPEQAWGNSKQVGPRADVYALGAILYECLTGRPPFRGATLMETLEQVRRTEPVSPRRLNPAVPRDLETICLKCLSKEPTARYLSARELALDLRRFLDGEPVQARPVGLIGRTWRAARRRPAAALAVILTVLTVVLGVGGSLAVWLYQTSEEGRQREFSLRAEAEDARKIADEAHARTVELAAQLERVVGFQQVQAAQREWEAGDVPRARALLAECSATQRGWEWHHVNRLLYPRIAVEGLLSPADSLAFVPDGGLLTGGRFDGLRIWDLDRNRGTASERLYLEGTQPKGGAQGGVAFVGGEPLGVGLIAGRGEVLARTERARLKAWSVQTGKLLREVMLPGEIPLCKVAVHPEGKWLAYTSFGANFNFQKPPIFVVDPVTGKELATLTGHEVLANTLAASPDGKWLASGSLGGEILVWDMTTFKLTGSVREPLQPVAQLAFSLDGNHLYAALEPGVLLGLHFPHLKRNFRSEFRTARFTCLGVRPDGERIACGTATGELVVFESVKGEPTGIYRGHLKPVPHVNAVAYSADGRLLASAGGDRSVRIWDARNDPGCENLTFPLPGGARLSSRGDEVLSINQDGAVRLWDATSGTLRAQTRVPTPELRLIPAALAERTPRAGIFAGDGSIRVWDWDRPDTLITLQARADRVGAVAFNQSGTCVYASGVSPTGNFLRVWEVATGAEIPALPQPPHVASAIRLSPDGNLLAVYCENDTLYVWNLPEGREVFRYRNTHGFPAPLSFSPDGTKLALSSGDGIRVWSVVDWKEMMRASTPVLVTHLSFTPDGLRLAGLAGRVIVWDVATGRESLTLLGSRTFSTLAWNPTGDTLTAAETDGTIVRWLGPPRP